MPHLLVVLAALAGLIASLTLVGLFMSGSHTAIVSARYGAAPDVVFDAIADPPGQVAWRSDLTAVERGPDRDGRPLWIESQRDGRMAIVHVELDRPRRLVTRLVDSAVIEGGWTFEVRPDGDGARLTITEAGRMKIPTLRPPGRLFSMTATAERLLRELGAHLGRPVEPTVVRAR